MNGVSGARIVARGVCPAQPEGQQERPSRRHADGSGTMWTGERLYELDRRIDPVSPDGRERPKWVNLHPVLQLFWISAAKDLIETSRAANRKAKALETSAEHESFFAKKEGPMK